LADKLDIILVIGGVAVVGIVGYYLLTSLGSGGSGSGGIPSISLPGIGGGPIGGGIISGGRITPNSIVVPGIGGTPTGTITPLGPYNPLGPITQPFQGGTVGFNFGGQIASNLLSAPGGIFNPVAPLTQVLIPTLQLLFGGAAGPNAPTGTGQSALQGGGIPSGGIGPLSLSPPSPAIGSSIGSAFSGLGNPNPNGARNR
jgi:hypothetical protein